MTKGKESLRNELLSGWDLSSSSDFQLSQEAIGSFHLQCRKIKLCSTRQYLNEFFIIMTIMISPPPLALALITSFFLILSENLPRLQIVIDIVVFFLQANRLFTGCAKARGHVLSL